MVGLPRRAGKFAFVLRRAVEIGKPLAVTSESTREKVLETARIMGIKPPEVIVITPKAKPQPDVSISLIIYDYYI
jgi:beta-phosphoglucomutase-like phosphatase (HAD superfamily)